MERKKKRYFSESSHDKNSVGNLSPALRKALNLENDMLPFWVYRMRILGYPPAWMQAAESTTLDVFDGSLSSSSATPNLEDGEFQDKLKYNKDTLIEFPGFNSPMPSDCKDDWIILGMPPYQKTQQLSVASQSMSFVEPVPYKRSKLDITSDSSNDSDNIQKENDNTSKKDEHSVLESSEKSPLDHSSSSEIIQTNEIIDSVEKKDSDDSSNDYSDNSRASNSNDSVTNKNPKKLKVLTYGVPVPETIKPKLPSLEKWSIGMGELLHFENLPNSTGAYKDKIKGVLEKIKNRFQK